MSSQTSSQNNHRRGFSACGGEKSSRSFNSLDEIINDYIENFQLLDEEEEKNWGSHSSLIEAVRTAALSTLRNGKKHPHQNRIPKDVLQDAAAKLTKVDFESLCAFEELHKRVNEHIREIKGIGPLAVYDISYRIGIYLNLSPEAVYIHCGAREGAEALLGCRVADKLEKGVLPKQFDILLPVDIENCLCIYKKHIARLKSSE